MSKRQEKEEQAVRILELRDKGLTVPKIARKLGISEATIYNRLKEAKQAATNAVIMTNSTKSVVRKAIDTCNQIVELNDKMWAVHNSITELDAPSPEQLDILFKSDNQIQKQLKLNHDILKDLYDIKRVQVFQETVMEVMDECDPKIRK